MHKASIILQSKKTEINKIEKLLFTLNEVYEIEQERFINFNIAVSEAIMNAIVHGNKESDDKRVYVDVFDNGKSIEVVIKDEGRGFDNSSIPDPTEVENLHKDHGRGIYIMKILTDGYESTSDGDGTIVRLVLSK
ncbi:MAG: ATP-binding protein [Ignavibacteria bacterium]|nr:ATP-binding protein [Ignavibacteria bacterium]